jgi:hypothetical protein
VRFPIHNRPLHPYLVLARDDMTGLWCYRGESPTVEQGQRHVDALTREGIAALLLCVVEPAEAGEAAVGPSVVLDASRQ